MREMLDKELAARLPWELSSCPQWVAWYPEPNPDPTKKDIKVPYDAHYRRKVKAASDNPATWTTFQQVARYLAGMDDTRFGRGFVFSDEYGLELVGVDLDHCRDVETGEIAAWAWEIVGTLDSYTEVSPSGTGVHIIAKGKMPSRGGRKRGDIEMYGRLRYFTVTGNMLFAGISTLPDRTKELAEVYANAFPSSASPPKPTPFVTIAADKEILRHAEAAQNGAKFTALWNGDRTGYASDSEADLALCSHLVFWTRGDAGRVDALFRQSALYRDKWDERHYGDGKTYGTATVAKAISEAKNFWTPIPGSMQPLKENDPRLHKFGGFRIDGE